MKNLYKHAWIKIAVSHFSTLLVDLWKFLLTLDLTSDQMSQMHVAYSVPKPATTKRNCRIRSETTETLQFCIKYAAALNRFGSRCKFFHATALKLCEIGELRLDVGR